MRAKRALLFAPVAADSCYELLGSCFAKVALGSATQLFGAGFGRRLRVKSSEAVGVKRLHVCSARGSDPRMRLTGVPERCGVRVATAADPPSRTCPGSWDSLRPKKQTYFFPKSSEIRKQALKKFVSPVGF